MTNVVRKPNFYLVGAAKCGTTSLARWLSEHPQIYMSPIKEPDYFYPNGRIRSLEEYESLFTDVDAVHTAVGEASVRYLFSETAIRAAQRYSGDLTKYLVMVRNPIEMAESLHAQRIYSGNENIYKYEYSWRAQDARKQNIYPWPRHWYTPEINIYGEFCKLGIQVSRLLQIVGEQRVIILFLDDFKSEPRKQWLKLLEFLELEDDGRVDFFAYNERKDIRSVYLTAMLKRLSRLKRTFGIRGSVSISSFLRNWNTIEGRGALSISPEFRAELQQFFKEDIELLAKISKRDLSKWK